MLETWFKHLGARIKDPGSFAAPGSLPDPVQQAAQHLWEAARAEARQDFDQRLKDGLAAATANVEAEKEKASIAESAAFSASAKAAHLQSELDALRSALEAERLEHRSTQVLVAAAQQRQAELQGELTEAHQATVQERDRADRDRAAADERAAGAERRAALEIERERMLRSKEEKAREAMARRFETVLNEKLAIAGQLQALEDRHKLLQAQASQREQDLLANIQRLEGRTLELQAELEKAHRELARAATPESLVEQIVAKLTPVVEHRGKPAPSGRAQTRKKTPA